jgi:DNA-binding transcriptional regulator YdaS (Cro superfamily)
MNYLQKSIELAGGQNALARKITAWHLSNGKNIIVKQQYIWKWLRSVSPVPPAEHCRAIEEITNGEVTRYQLRADVFGTQAGCECDVAKEAA